MKNNSLYNKVIDITRDYLGPSSSRVIDRQIQNHLHKEPENLSPEDMPVLAAWAEVAFSVITEDKNVAKEYTKRLLEVVDQRANRDLGHGTK